MAVLLAGCPERGRRVKARRGQRPAGRRAVVRAAFSPHVCGCVSRGRLFQKQCWWNPAAEWGSSFGLPVWRPLQHFGTGAVVSQSWGMPEHFASILPGLVTLLWRKRNISPHFTDGAVRHQSPYRLIWDFAALSTTPSSVLDFPGTPDREMSCCCYEKPLPHPYSEMKQMGT